MGTFSLYVYCEYSVYRQILDMLSPRLFIALSALALASAAVVQFTDEGCTVFTCDVQPSCVFRNHRLNLRGVVVCDSCETDDSNCLGGSGSSPQSEPSFCTVNNRKRHLEAASLRCCCASEDGCGGDECYVVEDGFQVNEYGEVDLDNSRQQLSCDCYDDLLNAKKRDVAAVQSSDDDDDDDDSSSTSSSSPSF